MICIKYGVLFIYQWFLDEGALECHKTAATDDNWPSSPNFKLSSLQKVFVDTDTVPPGELEGKRG